MQTTKTDAPVATSATERIEIETQRRAELVARQGDIAEQIFLTKLKNGDTSALKSERKLIDDEIADIDTVIAGPPGREQLGLRFLAAVEERRRLVAEMSAANERVQANGVAIREQNAKLDRLQKELDAEVKIAEKLSVNGCGHYEAQRDLDIHRKKFPGIPEGI